MNRIIDIDNNIVESEDDLGSINNNCRNHNVKISERGRGRGGAMGSVSSFSEAIRRRLYSSKVSIIWYFIFLFLICTFFFLICHFFFLFIHFTWIYSFVIVYFFNYLCVSLSIYLFFP